MQQPNQHLISGILNQTKSFQLKIQKNMHWVSGNFYNKIIKNKIKYL